MALTTIAVTASGGAGTSVGDTTVAINDGYINAIAVDIASAPATTDVTVTLVGPGALETTLLTLTNLAADVALVGLVNDPVDATGTADTANPAHPPVSGSIRVNVAQANDTDVVTAYLVHEDFPAARSADGALPVVQAGHLRSRA